MTLDPNALYQLLPAIHRVRDEEQGGPLKALLAVIAEQIAVMEENVEQLYDDQFIETCAEWAIPYIGDLIGYQPLHAKALGVGSPRAEVGHTIALRRRKGTAAALEQLARDVTGWNARAVEFFQTLATTQYMNHVRPFNHYAPDLRRWEALERLGTPFNTVAHTVDVRRIASGRGRYNIPNVGIFVWPVDAHSATRAPAVQVDGRRWRVSPLNHDIPLYNNPEAEDSITHLAEPHNVPMALSRRVLAQDLRSARRAYYGEGLSLAIYLNGEATPVPASGVCACNLSDDAGSWAHLPEDKIAIDPVLGRVAMPSAPPAPITSVEVTYHYGFSAAIGGGEYERGATFAAAPGQVHLRVPDDHATIQAALDALSGDGVVIITDNRRYEETLVTDVRAGGRIEVRAANERRPSVVLTGEWRVTGDADSELVVNGLLISGHRLRVPADGGNRLASLRLVHTTVVPGQALTPDGAPQQPDEASVVVDIADVEVSLTRSIAGGILLHEGARLSATDSIVDATSITGVAFAAPDRESAGGSLSLDGCTVVGKVHATVMPLISNTIVLAQRAPGDTWDAAVRAEQKQTGCVRFSWIPIGSRVPRRYHCQPGDNGVPAPRMASLRYGTPTYGRLSPATHTAIRQGADDEGEMGAFHHLLASLRETNLRLRVKEFLRVGLETGIFHEV